MSLRLALLGILLFAATAWGDSHVRVVRLSYVNGDVQMDRATGNGFENAILNMPVVYQSKVRTGDDGEAELEFENGSTLRLTPDTEISISDLSLTDSGSKVTHLSLEHGLAYLNWKHGDQSGSNFQMIVAGHALTVHKSAHLRIQSISGAASVAALNGEALISGAPQGELAIRKGETLTLDESDSRYFLAKSVESGAYDQWDKDRDDTRSLLARNQSNYVPSALSYGPDLGYYGNWYNSPSYGYVWQPYYAGIGWSPFNDGSWAWYPNLGWQWVSAYPWGFVPYHFGSWVFVNGFGWCWRRPHHWDGWRNVNNIFANGHGTGIIPPNGGHGTGVIPVGNGFAPRPPAIPIDGHRTTIVTVGKGVNAPWRNPALKNGHEIDADAFRSAGTGSIISTSRRAKTAMDNPVNAARTTVQGISIGHGITVIGAENADDNGGRFHHMHDPSAKELRSAESRNATPVVVPRSPEMTPHATPMSAGSPHPAPVLSAPHSAPMTVAPRSSQMPMSSAPASRPSFTPAPMHSGEGFHGGGPGRMSAPSESHGNGHPR